MGSSVASIGRVVATASTIVVSAAAGCGGGIIEYVYVPAEGGAAAVDVDSRATDSGTEAADAAARATNGSTSWATSGSRLRAIQWKAPDGAKEHAGWFDTERSEDCTFRSAEEGHERCLPDAYSLQAPRNPYRHYADANCYRPLVSRRVSDACNAREPEIRYVIVKPFERREFHLVGPRIYPSAPWVMTVNNECVPEQSTDVEYYDIGAAIPAGAFVEGSTMVEPASGPLTYVTRVGADGSRQRLRPYNPTLGVSCTPLVALDDVWRCAPAFHGAMLSDVFLDSACTEQAAECQSGDCNPSAPERASYGVTPHQETNRTRYSFFRIAPLASTPRPAFQRFGGSDCIENGTLGANKGRRIEEVPASSLVALSATLEATQTRLRRAVYEAGPLDAVYALTSTWRDTLLDMSCRVETTADKVRRCAPEETIRNIVYTDPDCTDPVVSTPTSGRRWARVPDARALKQGCFFTGQTIRAITNTAVVAYPSTYYQLTEIVGSGRGIECVRRDFATPEILWRLGDDMTSTFVAFERTLD